MLISRSPALKQLPKGASQCLSWILSSEEMTPNSISLTETYMHYLP